MLSTETVTYYQRQFDNEEEIYQEGLKRLEEEYLKKKEELLKKRNERLENIKKEKYNILLKETKLKGLKKQAFDNYIYGYSKMKKGELVKKVENRIVNEKLLGLQNDLFTHILFNYLEKDEKNNLRTVCKTIKKRVKYEKLGDIRNMKELEKRVNEIREINPVKVTKEIKAINFYYKNNPKLEKNKNYLIIRLIKGLLALNESINIKSNKVNIVIGMMLYVSERKEFLKDNEVFKNTVINKIDELMRNEISNKGLISDLQGYKKKILKI